ncbi:sigma 54-interacting transcriptional regulator [Aquiflexum sp.]|uniref:sigma-54-dependent Fis family transcriptional regulator n=1 Tax=Aquiflexum sp. TaxID=1872584 RepID=UPI003594295A
MIRIIVEHTHSQFGRDYFRVLVRHLSEALEVKGAWVTELLEKEQRLKSYAFWLAGKYVDHYEYDIVNTPCAKVVESRDCLLVPENVVQLFPLDPDLTPLNAVSYMGYPLFDENRKVIGHLAILHDAPLHPTKEQEAVFSLFVQRANAELIRLRTFEALQERKLRLSTLISNMHNAILEVDELGFVSMANPASCQLLGMPMEDLEGSLLFSHFETESSSVLRNILKNAKNPSVKENSVAIRKELNLYNTNGQTIPVEASFCSYWINSELFLTILIRDFKELRRAEQRIKILEEDSQRIGNIASDSILGECPAIQKIKDDIQQVAKSNSTVLLLGESGTGKEVFAKEIHHQSTRKDKPLIIVNCAAIPANLIESEFFGHEKGAFTGALQRREGRFSLADGGTIFLDELGELPLDLQPKLLRVLQEGEFETLGGNRTIKVDVRVIAATNRDLQSMVKEGTFREDLYYRLKVIPIHLPALRKRGKDILLLADLFIKKFSKANSKKIFPINHEISNMLLDYNWPGNIRELQHVIERAVILSKDGHLHLERFLPHNFPLEELENNNHTQINVKRVLTVQELEELEKQNIIAALEQTSWKISGNSGAAALLGIPPTTLNSKIKVFGLERPMPQ